MINLNKIQLIGNLTMKPERKETKGGTNLCLFSIATNRTYKDPNGESKSSTQYHNCIAWKKLSEVITLISRKGSRVYVEGEVNYNEWTDDTGKKNKRTEIVVQNFILLESRREQEEEARMNNGNDTTPQSFDEF